MQAVFEIVGFFVCAAGAAFLLSMLIHRAPRRKQAHALEPGAIARIKTSNGVYRTRYSRTRPDGLAFEAPLQRDHYVPIAVGEFVTVEAPMANGVVIFRSRVVDRDKDTKEIMLAVLRRSIVKIAAASGASTNPASALPSRIDPPGSST